MSVQISRAATRLERQGDLVSPATLENYDYLFQPFLRWLASQWPEVRRVDDLKVAVVRAYRAELTVSSPTLSGNLAAAFVFRLETEVEIRAACDLLGIEKEPENLARIAQLGRQEQGQEEIRYSECLHRDVDGNVGTLYVDLETEELREAFNTTPPQQQPELEPVA